MRSLMPAALICATCTIWLGQLLAEYGYLSLTWADDASGQRGAIRRSQGGIGPKRCAGTGVARYPQGGRTLVSVDLSSRLLRLADVGLRAAGRDPHPDAPPKLFSDVQLVTPATRRVDATGNYSARRLLLSRVEVTELSAPFTIEHGLIKAPEITGHFMGGNFVLHLDSDANQTPARSRIEMTLTDLQLAQMPHKAEPPYEGSLRPANSSSGDRATHCTRWLPAPRAT